MTDMKGEWTYEEVGASLKMRLETGVVKGETMSGGMTEYDVNLVDG